MMLITPRFARPLTLLAVLLACPAATAAELVMFWRAGCEYCERFDREIGPIYGRTDEGKAAPLRRVDIHGLIPPELKSIAIERVTPVFVLVEQGREIGRIRGYPGEDHFWGLLAGLIDGMHRSGDAGVD